MVFLVSLCLFVLIVGVVFLITALIYFEEHYLRPGLNLLERIEQNGYRLVQINSRAESRAERQASGTLSGRYNSAGAATPSSAPKSSLIDS
jgi:hypothetical protein